MPPPHALAAAAVALAVAAAVAPLAAAIPFAGGEYPQFAAPGRVTPLDGRWQFAWLGSVPDATAVDPAGIPTPLTVPVPASMDALPTPGRGLEGARGTALYRTTVSPPPGTLARIRVRACGFYCAVFVDGVRVGDHGGNGYTAFWVGGIPPTDAPTRTLEIVADNRFNLTTARLHAYVDDWYQYGGLFRSVEWHVLSPAAPGAVAAQAADVLVADAAAGAVDVRIRLHDFTETARLDVGGAGTQVLAYAVRHRGAGGAALAPFAALPTWVNVSIGFDGGAPTVFTAVPVTPDGAATVSGLRVPAPTLWSPASPALHTVQVTITGSSLGPLPGSPDTLTHRFGLRTVSVCPGAAGNGTVGVCVNGAPVQLKGYGRHDTNPQTGHALSTANRWTDLALIAGLGGNFVRVGHYTQHPEFLAMADEQGMLTATETIGWDSSAGTYTDPTWIAASLDAIEAAVNDTFNHPSTILYMYMNEAEGNDPAVCPVFATLNARYKSLRVQGLTSYATDKGTGDVCVAASGVDVLGFNSYFAWYSVVNITGNVVADIDQNIAAIAPAYGALADWMGTTHPGVPFYVSEAGAGAIPGWTDAMRGMWTEAYAGRVVSAVAQTVLRDPRWSGIALWQLMDQRVYNLNGALSRPRAFNNKGTFDENRKPKLPLYSAVFNAFRGLPEPDWLAAYYPPGA